MQGTRRTGLLEIGRVSERADLASSPLANDREMGSVTVMPTRVKMSGERSEECVVARNCAWGE